MAKGGRRDYPGQRLVVHRQSSHHQDSNPDPILLPYSVSIWCAVYKDNLYVTSYRGRRWVEDIIRDPHVRLKIGGQLFERTLSLVNDPDEKAAVLQAKGKKYPKWTVPSVSTATVFRVLPE